MSVAGISPTQPRIEQPPQEIAQKFLQVFNRVISGEDYSTQTFEAALEACRRGQWQILKSVEKEIEELSPFWTGTLINHAISKGEKEWVKALVTHQIGIYSTDGQGNTPLHVAAEIGALHLVEPLSSLMAEKNKEGKTPLHCAIEFGNIEIVKKLIEIGANTHQTLIIGRHLTLDPLGLAVMRGEKKCIALFIEKCNPKVHYSNTGNLFHLAIEFHQIEILQFLLETYPTLKDLIEDRSHNNLTPLNLAASLGEHEAIGILYHYGASLETQDLDQKTPLHHAALGGHYPSLELLTCLGAKVNTVDVDGKRPIDLLPSNPRCKTLLLRHHQKKTTPLPHVFPPKNLVFRGGGPKGVAYVGALKTLQEEKLLDRIERVAGTSAGAITASLVALNYPIKDLETLLKTTDLMDFLDPPFPKQSLEEAIKNPSLKSLFRILKSCIAQDPLKLITGPLQSLYKCTGICEGEAIRQWLEDLIAKQTGIPLFTFGDLAQGIAQGKPYKHLHLYGSKIGDQPEIVHLSSQDPQWNDVILSDAIRISMSIPGVFKPHHLHIRFQKTRVPVPDYGSFLDGGMLYNFPIETFDQKQFLSRENLGEEGKCPKFNKETLGFSLYSSLETPPPPENTKNIKELLLGISTFYLNGEQAMRQLNPYNNSRVIEIDVKEVGTLSFNMSEETKNTLIHSGTKSTKTFLETRSLAKIPRLTLPTPEEITFGAKTWEKHYGPINTSPLPEPLKKLLFTPCPIWPEQKFYQTHIIAFIPKITLQNILQKITLFQIEDLIQSANDQPCWVAMTRNTLPDCRKLTYEERCQRLPPNYAPPKLIEAAICTAFELLENNQRLFSEDSLSWKRWTQCEENLQGEQIALGNSDEEGIRIFPYPGKSFGGLAAIRRFF